MKLRRSTCQSDFENAELAWVDNSRTLIPIDQPEILISHLERFLARTT